MIVFLDLEETVIDEWGSDLLLPANIEAIRRLLQGNPVHLGLMSWAVWENERDKLKFTHDIQPYVEEALGFKFHPDLTWSMDDWAGEVFKHTGLTLDRKEDMFDMFKKEEVLFKLARHHPLFRGEMVILVDDAVEHDMTLRVPSRDCTVKFLNINNMVKNV